MFLAPPLAPEVKRRGRLFRVLSGLGLATTALVLLVANLVLMFVVYFAVIPSVSPQELYHRTWQMTRDNIYDQSKLKDWDQWEHKYDGQIKTDEDAVRFANEMLSTLNDPYTYLLSAPQVSAEHQRAEGFFIGIGVTFEQADEADANGQLPLVTTADGFPVVDRVFRGGPAHKAGIKSGDAIISIDGQPTSGLVIDELVKRIKGEDGTPVKLVVRHDGKDIRLTVVRGVVNIPVVSTRRLPGNVGYIRLETFSQWDTAEEMEQALTELSDCDALVVDLRDNGGGFIHSSVHIAALFLSEGVISTERWRVPELGYLTQRIGVTPNAGFFEFGYGWIDGLRVKVPYRPPNLAGDKPVVLLVNGGTASASELFAAALQDNKRAIVLGTKTFGKGIGQTYLPIGNGTRLRITNNYGFTPNGRWLGDGGASVSNGIVPDVVVEPAENLMFGEEGDNQLEEALKLLP